MKTKLTLALVALITSSAYAGIPKILPEFKNAQQLAEWREEMAAKHAATTTATEDHAFYTGKPYVETTGSYAFKYRSYNPELARWTSEDPCGFPDGANNQFYAPVPTTQLDLLGLLKVTVTGTPELTTSSGSSFNINVIIEAQQIGTSIAAEMEVGWIVGSGLSGWVVQHIQFVENVFNNDGTPWTAPGPLTSQF